MPINNDHQQQEGKVRYSTQEQHQQKDEKKEREMNKEIAVTLTTTADNGR